MYAESKLWRACSKSRGNLMQPPPLEKKKIRIQSGFTHINKVNNFLLGKAMTLALLALNKIPILCRNIGIQSGCTHISKVFIISLWGKAVKLVLLSTY